MTKEEELAEAKKKLLNWAKANESNAAGILKKGIKDLLRDELDQVWDTRAFDKTPVIDFGEGEWRLRYYEEKFHVKRA